MEKYVKFPLPLRKVPTYYPNYGSVAGPTKTHDPSWAAGQEATTTDIIFTAAGNRF
jgi:hypothetical protein